MSNQMDSHDKKSTSKTGNQQSGTDSTQNHSDDKKKESAGGGMGNARPDDRGNQADKSGGKGNVSQQSGAQKVKEQPDADRDGGGSSPQTRTAQDEKGQA